MTHNMHRDCERMMILVEAYYEALECCLRFQRDLKNETECVKRDGMIKESLFRELGISLRGVSTALAGKKCPGLYFRAGYWLESSSALDSLCEDILGFSVVSISEKSFIKAGDTVPEDDVIAAVKLKSRDCHFQSFMPGIVKAIRDLCVELETHLGWEDLPLYDEIESAEHFPTFEDVDLRRLGQEIGKTKRKKLREVDRLMREISRADREQERQNALQKQALQQEDKVVPSSMPETPVASKGKTEASSAGKQTEDAATCEELSSKMKPFYGGRFLDRSTIQKCLQAAGINPVNKSSRKTRNEPFRYPTKTALAALQKRHGSASGEKKKSGCQG